MHYELKKLSPEGIERALSKVERYRLLNEPEEAESICRDILDVNPNHQQALTALLLALTDQFDDGTGRRAYDEAEAIAGRLEGAYERAYYGGIVAERRGTACLRRGTLGAGEAAFPWYQRAMECYEEAERLHPPGDETALLRWNTCARRIMRRGDLRPAPAYAETELE